MAFNTLSPKQVVDFDLELKDTDIAWIAGLLEGEGTFGNDKRTTNYKFPVPFAPFVKLRMSDSDVVYKFANFVNKNVTELTPPKTGLGKKLIYSCYVGDRATMYYLLNKILPYMGQRRNNEIVQQLQYIRDWMKWFEEGGRDRNKFKFVENANDQINQDIAFMEKTGENQPEI